MFPQREAIIRLLQDEDVQTVELVKSQLVNHGRSAIPHLLDLLNVAGDRVVCSHVQAVLGEIDATEAQEELSLLCGDFPDHGGVDALECAALLLARAVSPGMKTDYCLDLFDDWGEILACRMAGAASEAARVAVLGEFFGEDLGFRGDVENYYSAGNSLLPDVIRRRRGIPLSLALIYLFVASRAGLEVDGVNFPGHFLVRFEDVLIDPFEGGKRLSLENCATILLRQNLRAERAFFEPADARAILRRMMVNLLYIFQSTDKKKAHLVSGWLADLEERG